MTVVTEAEALEKVCPERSYSHLPPAKCVGSECMAWRNFDRVAIAGKAFDETDIVTRGYCGLAGPLHEKRGRLWGR